MYTQGTLLGERYRLLRSIGDGGMAHVFAAEDTRLNREVAVKILHPQLASQPELVRRFEQEGHFVAGLTDPNIVAIYDVGHDLNNHYIVMEYVAGGSLKEFIARQGPLSLESALAITRQLGSALDVAHSRGIIHRDVKSQNILLTPTQQVKVGDFGIARALADMEHTTTVAGSVLGSVAYIAPEQALGTQVTAESDLYSSGVVLYEMLTGRLPFLADTPLAMAMQHVTQDPVPLHAVAPTLPPAVNDVVLKALSKSPENRYHSGAALTAALAAAASGTAMAAGVAPLPVRADPQGLRPGSLANANTRPDRRRALLPLLALLAGGAALFTVLGAAHNGQVATSSSSGRARHPSRLTRLNSSVTPTAMPTSRPSSNRNTSGTNSGGRTYHLASSRSAAAGMKMSAHHPVEVARFVTHASPTPGTSAARSHAPRRAVTHGHRTSRQAVTARHAAHKERTRSRAMMRGEVAALRHYHSVTPTATPSRHRGSAGPTSTPQPTRSLRLKGTAGSLYSKPTATAFPSMLARHDARATAVPPTPMSQEARATAVPPAQHQSPATAVPPTPMHHEPHATVVPPTPVYPTATPVATMIPYPTATPVPTSTPIVVVAVPTVIPTVVGAVSTAIPPVPDAPQQATPAAGQGGNPTNGGHGKHNT